MFTVAMLGLTLAHSSLAQTATPERVDEIAQHGKHVMPFDLKQTQHFFTTTEKGGVQQVIAKDA